MSGPDHGCVTNFSAGDTRLTVWRYGERFVLREFTGCQTLPLTYDPLFQALAAELYWLAGEVGALRRKEMEREPGARHELAGPELADALEAILDDGLNTIMPEHRHAARAALAKAGRITNPPKGDRP